MLRRPMVGGRVGRHYCPPSNACGPQEATSSSSTPTGRAGWGTGALHQPRGGGSFGEMTFLQPGAEAPHPQATQYRLQTQASLGHHYTCRCGHCRAEPALTHLPMPTGWAHSGHQPSTSCMGLLFNLHRNPVGDVHCPHLPEETRHRAAGIPCPATSSRGSLDGTPAAQTPPI